MALVNVPFTIQTEAEAAQVAARSAAQDQMRRLLTPQAGSGEFAGRFSPVGGFSSLGPSPPPPPPPPSALIRGAQVLPQRSRR
jgi:hypothetical protein